MIGRGSLSGLYFCHIHLGVSEFLSQDGPTVVDNAARNESMANHGPAEIGVMNPSKFKALKAEQPALTFSTSSLT